MERRSSRISGEMKNPKFRFQLKSKGMWMYINDRRGRLVNENINFDIFV